MTEIFHGHRPVIAILRGVTPGEAAEIGEALVENGLSVIEVPLNSPDPMESISRLANALGERAFVGAGTVLTPGDVEKVAAAGGRIVLSPNTDTAIIGRTKALGLVSCPGAFTATECFAGLGAGADMLKLFPASHLGPSGFKALGAVLPSGTVLIGVGGVDAPDFEGLIGAGASGFGIGSSLYAPGRDAADVGRRAAKLAAAWDAHTS